MIQGKVRTVVLKILKELLQYQSEMFMPYAELTILRLLEFEKDTDKEVCTCGFVSTQTLLAVTSQVARLVNIAVVERRKNPNLNY